MALAGFVAAAAATWMLPAEGFVGGRGVQGVLRGMERARAAQRHEQLMKARLGHLQAEVARLQKSQRRASDDLSRCYARTALQERTLANLAEAGQILANTKKIVEQAGALKARLVRGAPKEAPHR